MKNYNIIKAYCNKIFLVGPGNFWFEKNKIGNDKSLLYRFYSVALISTYILMTILEWMASFMGDFPEDEQRDCVTFSVSHTIVLIKILSLIRKKDLIRSLNERMIGVCERIEEPALMENKYKIMKINVIIYFSIVYGAVICFVFEGLRKLLTGSHFVVIVTYYPSYEDNSTPATLTRILFTLVLCMMMMTMIISVDSFTMVYLIMYKYKFITLRRYFENLEEEFNKLNATGNTIMARERLCKGLIDGIAMHGEVISCIAHARSSACLIDTISCVAGLIRSFSYRLSKDIDKVFGTAMASQLCLSSGSSVSLLLQLALTNNLTIVATLKVIFFVFALFFLLGLFLCNAGEITYQASRLTDAIFYCGWHACPVRYKRRNIRKIIHFSIANAQKPLVMKAFKMIELTYGTFLSVLRMTYSVFALIYAQNE